MGQFTNYYNYVDGEAVSFVDEYLDELLDNIEGGDTDVYSFINDENIHNWCDNDFIYVDLMDSAEILEQSDNVEEDSGLWEGQEPREAIKTQAFFTYRNDLSNEVKDVFENKLNEKLSELQDEIVNLKEEFDALAEEDYDEMNEEGQEQYDYLSNKIDDIEYFISNLEEAIESL